MATARMDVTSFVGKLLEQDDVDALREGVQVLAQLVMEAEVSGQIGAGHYERSSERTAYRNGYRTRRWDTRVGTIELKIPKVTAGVYFPSLLEPRRRAEKALHAVGGGGLREGGVHPQGRRPGPGPRHRRDLPLGGVQDLQVARRGGEGLPASPDRAGLPVPVAGRHIPQGQGEWPRRVGGHGGGRGGHRGR